MNKRTSGLAILTIVAATFLGIKNVRAELVFEEDLAPAKKDTESSRVIDEEDLARDEAAPAAAREEREPELSRSERLRRHRMRAELRNEDKLTERLEELRLKDEMKRTDSLLGSGVDKEKAQDATLPVAEQKVGTLATEQPATVMVPAAAPVVAQPVAAQSVAVAAPEEKKEEENKMIVGITPRFGLAGILNSNFEVNSKYALGLTVAVDVIEHFGIEAGYQRAAYNVAAGTAYGSMYYGYTMQTLNMTQNVFDIGTRFNILGRKSRVQPFVSAGIGYYRNNINLDQNTLNYVRMYSPALANDFTVSGFLGYVGGGAEFKITENIGLSGMFRYYNVFSSRQSNPISSAAFVNPNGAGTGAGYGAVPGGDPRFAASQNFGKAHFYTLQAGVTVSF